MNNHSNRAAGSRHYSNAPEVTITQSTIQQQPAGSSKTKELRSHPCITIKWSLDSDSRRPIGMPPPAVGGGAACGSAAVFTAALTAAAVLGGVSC